MLVTLTCLFSSTARSQDNKPNLLSTLSVIAVSDSTNVNGIHYQIDAYKDETCAKPSGKRKLWSKRYASSEEQFDSIELAAGSPYYFQIQYKEARRGETRQCTILAAFEPESGQRYRAVFETTGQVSNCQLRIENLANSSEQVALKFPEFSCKKVGRLGVNNRTPVHNFLKRF